MGFLRLRSGNGGSVAGRVLCYDTLIEVMRGTRRKMEQEEGEKEEAWAAHQARQPWWAGICTAVVGSRNTGANAGWPPFGCYRVSPWVM